MFHRFLIALFLCVVSIIPLSGHAQDENLETTDQNTDESKESSDEPDEEAPSRRSRRRGSKPNNESAATSTERERRARKVATVAAQVSPNFFLPAFGLRGGMFVNPDLMIEGEYNIGVVPLLIDLKTTYAEIAGKYFLGKTFYVKGGMVYRSVRANFKISNADFSDEVEGSLRVDRLGIDAFIGNQWQWDTFTAGFDWLGYYVPVVKVKDEVSIPANADPASRQTFEKDFKDALSSGGLMYFKIYGGVSF